MSTLILYEQPLNERIRIFLRLEHFFSQALHFRGGVSNWDSQASIDALVEILFILDRMDIRSEVIKELERHMGSLSRLMDTPSIDHQRLDILLGRLSQQVQKMQHFSGKFGSELRDNELLISIRQRAAVAGGTCGFDLPAYHFWLNQPLDTRIHQLSHWMSEFSPLHDGITLALSTIRNSVDFKQEIAHGGIFLKTLDPQHPCQLLRISLPSHMPVYPEVSGSKHRVNVRFLEFPETGRPRQVVHDIEFGLSCCAI